MFKKIILLAIVLMAVGIAVVSAQQSVPLPPLPNENHVYIEVANCGETRKIFEIRYI